MGFYGSDPSVCPRVIYWVCVYVRAQLTHPFRPEAHRSRKNQIQRTTPRESRVYVACDLNGWELNSELKMSPTSNSGKSKCTLGGGGMSHWGGRWAAVVSLPDGFHFLDGHTLGPSPVTQKICLASGG